MGRSSIISRAARHYSRKHTTLKKKSYLCEAKKNRPLWNKLFLNY